MSERKIPRPGGETGPRYPQPGEVLLDKYRVESLIGEGGMGAVIKAKHLDLDEHVAIKCLLPEMMDRKDIVARFLREAKAAVKLKGEHVARVLDVGRLANQVPYIVMEYLEGADLNAIIKHHGAQEPAIAVDLILQACQAIAEAHSLGIIHRDIKASNFFITQPENQAATLKVLDFGIATAPEGTSDLTSTQSVIGTPSYMAPEQMRSSRTADARSDIWSIGVVLYELLEGARPFRSEVYSELVLKVGMDPPVPMENPAVPETLRAITLRCLEKPVEKRYQTVAELALDLMPFASDPIAARHAAEQCTRLLGRRASKLFEVPAVADAPKTPTGSRPPGNDDSVPRRITPARSHAIQATPISSSQPSLPGPSIDVLGRPPSTSGALPRPVSVVPIVAKSRAPLIAFAAIAGLAIAGAGVFWATRDPAPAREAATPPEPPRPEPVEAKRPPPVEPPPVEPPPVEVKPEQPRPEAAKRPAKQPARRVPPKKDVAPPPKQDPPPPGGSLYERRQ